MLHTPRSTRGMVVAPHHLASEAGLSVLRDGGNAIEATIATAATLAVVYPHMNGVGGDNFWLIRREGEAPVGIDACGAAWGDANAEFYAARGLESIPPRGPLAAITVPGAISGWHAALDQARRAGGRMPLARLLEEAQYHARNGFPVTQSQHDNTRERRSELEAIPGFAEVYLPEGKVPGPADLFRQPALAGTLQRLAEAGLEDFYGGELARLISAELRDAGSPLDRTDLGNHRARLVEPLQLETRTATVYNLPPPTQGLASLMILGIFERLGCGEADGYEFVHGLVEATKRAFLVRDQHVTDPAFIETDLAGFLDGRYLDEAAQSIDPGRALPWTGEEAKGDTVWFGAIDADGTAVSCIQSLYWEFGSGTVLPRTGITCQNRGITFSLRPGRNSLAPDRKPFHTIQPAAAAFRDGRTLVYGTMGGEGQPQTQAAIFARYATFGHDLQQAVTAPRWLLGRTWGEPKMNLRIESRFRVETIEQLRRAGHDLELVGPFDPVMGHAGAIARLPSGVMEGAADPRGDGLVSAF